MFFKIIIPYVYPYGTAIVGGSIGAVKGFSYSFEQNRKEKDPLTKAANIGSYTLFTAVDYALGGLAAPILAPTWVYIEYVKKRE